MINYLKKHSTGNLILFTVALMFISSSAFCGNSAKEMRKAAKEGNIEEIRQLLESGVDINAAGGKKGRTALHVAAVKGHLEVTEFLLSEGADVNVVSKKGATPLFLAAKKGYTGIVQALLAHGADKSIKNNKGDTPMDAATDNGNSDIRELLKHHELAIGTTIKLSTSTEDSQKLFQDSAVQALRARGWAVTGKKSDRIEAQIIKKKRIYRLTIALVDNSISINYLPHYGSHRLNYLLNIRKDLLHILPGSS